MTLPQITQNLWQSTDKAIFLVCSPILLERDSYSHNSILLGHFVETLNDDQKTRPET